jgi:aryl-alcohol dehydrogenase-like predicted oxidoreductase
MTVGDEQGWGSPKAEAQKVYEIYREAGGNFIDTGNFYTNGTSGRFLGVHSWPSREHRLTHKILQRGARHRSERSGQRKSMMQAVEASLKRLQTVAHVFFLSIMKGASEHANLTGAYQVIEELHAKRRSPTEDSSAQLLASLDQCLLLLRGDGSNASSCVRSLQYCRRV